MAIEIGDGGWVYSEIILLSSVPLDHSRTRRAVVARGIEMRELISVVGRRNFLNLTVDIEVTLSWREVAIVGVADEVQVRFSLDI